MFHVLANVKWLIFFFALFFFGTQKKRIRLYVRTFVVFESRNQFWNVMSLQFECYSVSFRKRSNNLFPPACLSHWCLCFWLLLVPLFLLFGGNGEHEWQMKVILFLNVSPFSIVLLYFVELIANTAVDLTFDWNQFEKKQTKEEGEK